MIISLLWAAFNADSLPLIGGGTSYSAYFTEDASLRVGDEVRIAGVKVGKVDSIALAGRPGQGVFKVKNAFIGNQSTLAIKIKTCSVRSTWRSTRPAPQQQDAGAHPADRARPRRSTSIRRSPS